VQIAKLKLAYPLRREFRGEINQLLDRRGYTLTEIAGSNLALAAGGVNSDGALQAAAVLFSSSSAKVTSDTRIFSRFSNY
jgi:hypothetical protein